MPLRHRALFAARDLGLAVPRDVSITGFDDLDLAAHLEVGTLAADYLRARIAGRAVPAHQELDTQLIVRGTTARSGGRED